MAGDTVAAALTQVAQRRAHEYVAEQIRRVVVLRVVAPGSRLPYEQELARALGVSRATITQALRQLEREGLVEVRRGRGGGVFTQSATTPTRCTRCSCGGSSSGWSDGWRWPTTGSVARTACPAS